jgi:hypothetical protein
VAEPQPCCHFSPEESSSWPASSADQTFLLLAWQTIHPYQVDSYSLTLLGPWWKFPRADGCFLSAAGASSWALQCKRKTLSWTTDG